jgi:hypothetical protein
MLLMITRRATCAGCGAGLEIFATPAPEKSYKNLIRLYEFDYIYLIQKKQVL